MSPTVKPRAAELAAIAASFGIADIYLFGSRSAATASGSDGVAAGGPVSDLDIAVRPNRDTVLGAEARVELTLALERALPTGPVDLLVLPEAGPFLALAAIRGDLLFCADPLDQAEYELYVLRRAGDLAPLERERQEIVLAGGR